MFLSLKASDECDSQKPGWWMESGSERKDASGFGLTQHAEWHTGQFFLLKDDLFLFLIPKPSLLDYCARCVLRGVHVTPGRGS